MSKKGIVVVLLTMSMFLLFGCDTLNSLMQYEKPTANLTGVSFGEVSLKEAQLLLDVEIKNPYALDLPLLNVDYDLQSGGLPLLNGKADLASAIPAKSSKVVTLPVSFKYLDLLNALTSLKDVRPGSQIPYTAKVGLGIDSPVAGNIRLPLTQEGTLVVPTAKDLAGTDWRDLLKDGNYLEILK
jgi:LEA14-like dessication related protein